MKILIAASEAMPFVKTGGLADVAGALPKELLKVGLEAAVIMPKHSKIKAEYQDEIETIASIDVRLGWRTKYLGIQTMMVGDVRYFFLDNEGYCGGAGYKGGDEESEQYLFFCRAVIAALPFLGFKPDVIHCNDWHTAMIPMLLKTQYGGTEWAGIKTVFTIHNIKFQGMMGFKLMSDILGIPENYNTPEFVEAHGCANMMKAGLVFADWVTTVSPTYAEEITSSFFGMGMEGIIAAKKMGGRVTGIINGIDTEDFDPATDPAIPTHYDISTLPDKKENKKSLRAEFGLNIKLSTPIVCMITRLTAQKGLDLVQYALEELLQEDMAFVMLGSGDRYYEDFFNYIAGKYPDKTGIYIGYDEGLARRIYAGSDFLLMPSQFEPCGLSQMIAQRYGTLPIVRETGGLADTVSPYNQYEKTGDGFSFSAFNAHYMMTVIRLALDVYKNDKPVLRLLKKNAMMKNNSFLESAGKYRELYETLLQS